MVGTSGSSPLNKNIRVIHSTPGLRQASSVEGFLNTTGKDGAEFVVSKMDDIVNWARRGSIGR